ncbi:M1 family aminopeptidase [Bacteroidota bacterium]
MFSQTDSIKEQFYKMEYQNWLESISLSENSNNRENFDVTFYDLKLFVWIDLRYIYGSLLCRFKATEDNLTTIELDLTDSLNIVEINGNASNFSRGSNKISVQLNQSFMTGEEGEVVLTYKGIPPQYRVNDEITKGLVYETHGDNEPIIASLCTPYLAHQWWPCKDGPGDKPDSMYISITIPDVSVNGIPLVAVSNGTLDKVSTSIFGKTFHWRERYPIPPYYVMCAISNYKQFQQTYYGEDGIEFPIVYYVFEEDFYDAQYGVAGIPEVISIFSDLFGSYPFNTEKYGMTQLGFYGGIENQTNTIQNSLREEWFSVSVHELAHQWFGDMITCKDWHHGWLNEGFATYSEALYAEKKFGINHYRDYMENIAYHEGGTVYLSGINNPAEIFISVIYRKGAWILHMLRGIMGDDLFFNCLKQYSMNSQFRYNHATTEDFKSFCENISGIELDYFFEQWIYDEYYPIYNYDYQYDSDESILHLTIDQLQGNYGRRQLFIMPVQIKLNYVNGFSEIKTVMNDQQSQEFLIPVTSEVASLEFDPNNWILKESVVTDVEKDNEIPVEVTLYQNFPNPFNPGTVISFQLSSRSNVKLTIFDLLGREIVELINEEMSAGTHEINFNVEQANKYLTSGVYIYRLSTDNFQSVRKMILLR